ncbi:MAG: ParB N-terminal domain-containing protein [Pseudomonadota bacterium]
MVKRRRLETPTAAELDKIETEFKEAQEDATGSRPQPAPIAQVAAEAAALTGLPAPEDVADAQALRDAQNDARLIELIDIDAINPNALIRDRTVIEAADQQELRDSILANGLRLPIEVFELTEPHGPFRYGLVSGYRRHMAVSELYEKTEIPTFAKIRALVVPRKTAGDTFAAMVEENEVRAGLSPFERGRIAVVAHQEGAFGSVEEAVNKMFATASKAKRSKIRSFALVFEELGDMLEYGDSLSERQGLRLATALREGQGDAFRIDLSRRPQAANFAEEWARLEPVLTAYEAQVAPEPSRGGRPRKAPAPAEWSEAPQLRLTNGMVLNGGRDKEGYFIRFSGREIDPDALGDAMRAIRQALERD